MSSVRLVAAAHVFQRMQSPLCRHITLKNGYRFLEQGATRHSLAAPREDIKSRLNCKCGDLRRD